MFFVHSFLTFSAAVDLAETWTSRDITEISLETELVGTVAGTVHNDAVLGALRVATDAGPAYQMEQELIISVHKYNLVLYSKVKKCKPF